jgi:putative membrane protein
MTLSNVYPWLEGLHVASALLFVGGLIAETALTAALPAAEELTPDQHRAVSVVRAWDQRLTTPAMRLVWGLGLTLGLSQGWFSAHWLQAKLVFVLALSALHGVQSGTLRRLAGGRRTGAEAGRADPCHRDFRRLHRDARGGETILGKPKNRHSGRIT